MDDDGVYVTDSKTGKQKMQFKGHKDGVGCIKFSPDGTMLVSGGDDLDSGGGDGVIRLWDVATGSEIKKITGYTGSVNSVSFSPAVPPRASLLVVRTTSSGRPGTKAKS